MYRQMCPLRLPRLELGCGIPRAKNARVMCLFRSGRSTYLLESELAFFIRFAIIIVVVAVVAARADVLELK